MATGAPAAILDVDGTLVDNNYQHALAWHLALRRCDLPVAVWRVHRAVGLGSDRIVADLLGEDAEAEHGDRVREHETELFGSMIEQVAPIAGAAELVRDLEDEGREVVLASSGDREDVERQIAALGIDELVHGWTTSADVDASKPEPDLIEAALAKLTSDRAVMVGDTPYDVEAAARAGIETIAVLSGGFPKADLLEAGAVAIYESVAELHRELASSPLAAT